MENFDYSAMARKRLIQKTVSLIEVNTENSNYWFNKDI